VCLLLVKLAGSLLQSSKGRCQGRTCMNTKTNIGQSLDNRHIRLERVIMARITVFGACATREITCITHSSSPCRKMNNRDCPLFRLLSSTPSEMVTGPTCNSTIYHCLCSVVAHHSCEKTPLKLLWSSHLSMNSPANSRQNGKRHEPG
jgi:hypothetical protein